jgi:hypothetical protein
MTLILLTHSYLLNKELQPECISCVCPLSIYHILLECSDYTPIRIRLFGNIQSMQEIWAIFTVKWFSNMYMNVTYTEKKWSFKSSSVHMNIFTFIYYPLRIRVRIDPPHPLVCHKRRLNGAVLRMRHEKPRSRVTAGVARIKIPPCSKALSAERRPQFSSLSPAMLTSPYTCKWKIPERDLKR